MLNSVKACERRQMFDIEVMSTAGTDYNYCEIIIIMWSLAMFSTKSDNFQVAILNAYEITFFFKQLPTK